MDDDEWFYGSFRRYNELQMFDFPNSVHQMDLTSTNNLCVALDDDGKNRNEILIFFLPSSLRTDKSIQGMKLDRHLSFDHGYFTNSQLVQIKCVPNEEKLFISEKHGVALYDINCSNSDIIQKLANIPCDIPDARLAVSGRNHHVALSGSANSPKKIVNFESMNTVLSIQDKSTVNSVFPAFSSSDVVSFADTVTGQVISYDIRDGKPVNIINSSGASSHWTFNTSFDIGREVKDNLEMFLFSTSGDFLVYEVRKACTPIIQAKHSLYNTSENTKMNVNPINTKLFSVCGFDENLYICELNENTVDVIFKHDGHPYNKDEFESNVHTLCSLWLSFISMNTLVSCGNNSSVQCWQYKIS